MPHVPALVEEVMTLLGCGPHQTFVDATLGGGGHAAEILNRTEPDGVVIGMEWDMDAISEAKTVLEPFGERAKIFHENFVDLPAVLKKLGLEAVDGILVDLGLSSIQLEKTARGFSLKGEGPLDMRMDQRRKTTASDLLNDLPQEELERILFDYGEERWAKQIARGIVNERRRGPILTTQALRRIVYRSIPRRFQPKRIDAATKTFQALRIRVNDELENLKHILETGWRLLRKGGRMCIISFHSLEDRMVKEAFRTLERGGDMTGQGAVVRVVTKKPVTPSEEERRRNPRCRSAKLRCAERV